MPTVSSCTFIRWLLFIKIERKMLVQINTTSTNKQSNPPPPPKVSQWYIFRGGVFLHAALIRV